MKRFLSKMTLLAFATFGLIASAATASPVIDPPEPAPSLVSMSTRPLTDGWYSAALQQTIINAAKKQTTGHVHARQSASTKAQPTLKFGLNAIYVNGCLNGTLPDRTMGGGNNNYDYYGDSCT